MTEDVVKRVLVSKSETKDAGGKDRENRERLWLLVREEETKSAVGLFKRDWRAQ